MATVTVGAVDHGRTVDAGVGDLIVVHLSENPTTGYRWSLEPVDESLLEKEGDAFVADSGAAMGSAGKRRFQLRAKSAGTTPISAKHWREWSGEGSVTERFSVQVRSTALPS